MFSNEPQTDYSSDIHYDQHTSKVRLLEGQHSHAATICPNSMMDTSSSFHSNLSFIFQVLPFSINLTKTMLHLARFVASRKEKQIGNSCLIERFIPYFMMILSQTTKFRLQSTHG